MFRSNAREGNDYARDVRVRRAREAAVGAYQRQNRAPRSRGQAWNDRVVENQGGRACRCASASARADRWMLKGQMDFRIGNERRSMVAGDVAVIPGDTEHEGFFPEDTEVVDIFAPPREDFLAGGTPAYMRAP